MADNGVTDNHKEGSVEDINDTTKSNDTSNVAATFNDNGKGGTTPSQLYNKLTTLFQPLAEYIFKHPQLANFLHGFILKAQKILCDKAPTQAKQSLLELFNSTKTSFPTVLMSAKQKKHSMGTITELIYRTKQNSNMGSIPITQPKTSGHPKTQQYKYE